MSDTSTSQLLLVGSGILIGLVISLGTWNMIASLEDNTLERVVARDLGLALSTIISAPGDMDIRYLPRSRDLRITINQTIVNVRGNTGVSTYRFLRLADVNTESAILVNQISVPIRKQGNLLFFEEITSGCDFQFTINDLPLQYRVSSDLPETKTKLDLLVQQDTRIRSRNIIDNNVLFLEIKKGDSNRIEFYGEEDKIMYRKFACNLFEEAELEFIEIAEQRILLTLKEDNPEQIINALNKLLK
jgi:hypothetical protein